MSIDDDSLLSEAADTRSAQVSKEENARAMQARAFSIGMAVSCASWVVLGFSNASPEDRFTLVRIGLGLLHGSIAVLFALRIPARAVGSVVDVVAALPSLVLSGMLYRLAPAPSLWPHWLSIVFFCATLFTLASLLTLGKSFAFVPARRDLVTRGPYSIVRHPAYLGELLMTLTFGAAAIFASSSLSTTIVPLALFIVLLPAVVWRIHAEERVMHDDDAWAAYTARTRSRLLPFVW